MNSYSILVPLLLVANICGKYVYVQKPQGDWFYAQKYCWTDYTDLAPINNEHDINLIRKLTGNTSIALWFGLMKDANEWMWSGGGKVSTFFWGYKQPNTDLPNENHGLLINYEWHDAPANFNLFGFLCFKVHVVGVRKTWEEALQYCRKYHYDVASVASETELMLIRKEVKKHDYVTQDVWIGLHFLAGDWQWVDGEPWGYEAWGSQQKPLCPVKTRSCAALQVMGPLQPLSKYDPAALNTGVNVVAGIQDVKVWNAQNCDEKLHFLCY